ncbi:MAG: hypothetical protein HRT36_02210 [Alphaproteobacteria bacterium]|nr:hypothetical protein [Alphaproteobacteria bacterium]
MKFMAEAEPASLAQTRDSFVKTRTLLLNRIHALYNRRRMRLKKEGLASRKKLIELDTLREQTLNLTTALTKLDSAIEAATEKKGWLRRADQHRKVSECAQLQSCSQVLAIWITWPVLTNSQPVCIP